jgi:two-component system, OmpR family, KDP operon response regulator KdpE
MHPEAALGSPSPSRSRPAEQSILVVEDDPAMAEVLETSLAARGMAVSVESTGGGALDAAGLSEPDLVILDLGLPDMDGIEVCRQLRRWSANPILVLSADGAEDRKVAALDEGANDYVTKPFSMNELLARMRVALRHRALVAAIVDPTVIVLGDLTIDTGARTARIGGDALELTRKQFDLLVTLARNPGRVLTHHTLLDLAWGAGGGTTESLRVHVTHLRQKLGSGPERPQVLTSPGTGYSLSMPG